MECKEPCRTFEAGCQAEELTIKAGLTPDVPHNITIRDRHGNVFTYVGILPEPDGSLIVTGYMLQGWKDRGAQIGRASCRERVLYTV